MCSKGNIYVYMYICMYIYIHIYIYTFFFSDSFPFRLLQDIKVLPRWLSDKDLPANAGDEGEMGSVLGQEDSLEEEMATHSSIPAWRIPWTEEPGGLQSRGSQSWTQLSIQDTEYNSLCCIECPCYLFILHIVVQIF